MEDIDPAVYLTLPPDIRREIELTMRFRRQRELISKSIFLNDEQSYFESSLKHTNQEGIIGSGRDAGINQSAVVTGVAAGGMGGGGGSETRQSMGD
eukprot:CAMPEP_0174985376 /NCGR_PEP_ID=MMETSP0004_2-20121128/18306_1 /TAXON_ID=420556 /ORGANISM="Ochromonas sp., Strain CCMP1393" /LENGTH=95 /DNA_ID=CAMNT_0016238015 /DNA_START=1 /DNA_END=285 /DNA_ORIENTATION=-